MSSLLDDDTTSGSRQPPGLTDVDRSARPAAWSAASHPGKRRTQNEDAWAKVGHVFALADGIGGLTHGREAARRAVETVTTAWTDQSSTALAVLHEANNAVGKLSASTSSSTGCTLTALRFLDSRVQILHVGDSRVYRLRSSALELLTVDHNLRSHLLAAGIAPRSARTSGPLGALTSYLGMPQPELHCEIRSVRARAGDRFIVCTDGVYRSFDDEEFATQAALGNPASAAQRLTDTGAGDDATAIVIDIATTQLLEGREQ